MDWEHVQSGLNDSSTRSSKLTIKVMRLILAGIANWFARIDWPLFAGKSLFGNFASMLPWGILASQNQFSGE
jgi:hypothetical protein